MAKDNKLGHILRNMPKKDAARIISQLSHDEAIDIIYDWDIWKRPEQHYDLNWPEQYCMAMCGRGWGKLFYPETDVLTVNRGWVKLEDIEVGDKVFDETGAPCNVTAVYHPPMDQIGDTYEIFFSDGTSLKTCEDHQWVTWTKEDKDEYLQDSRNPPFPPSNWATIESYPDYGPKVRTTQEVLESLFRDCSPNHLIPVCSPVKFPKKELTVSPYIFGHWLGDGSRDFVPPDYLYNTPSNRLELLTGVMDSGGNYDGDEVSIECRSEYVSEIVRYLAASLGQQPVVEGKLVRWVPTMQCFRITQKACRIVFRGSEKEYRGIIDYKKIPKVEGMRCITVDSPNSMWLVGKNLIPTHNTKFGSETVRQIVHEGVDDIVIIAPTSSDLREVITEGRSGILACAGPKDKYKPEYIPSKSRIEWYDRNRKQVARARLISAEEPDRIRGINASWAWWDELSSFHHEDAFHQAAFGLRISPAKGLITTTPKSTKLMQKLALRFGKDIRLIRGSTYDNSANLDDNFLRAIEEEYGGTRLGKQELLGELLLINESALWTPDLIISNTVFNHQVPKMMQIAIGVDPSVSKKKHSDLTGIVVVGLGEDNIMYILHDASGQLSPNEWASKVVQLYDMYSYQAPVVIVVEKNQGGELVKNNLTRLRPFLPVKDVFSSVNKIMRAEPIALLAEQGKLKHIKEVNTGDLETEMTTFDGLSRQKSPDRMDAMVFAATHLMPVNRNRIVTKEFFL